MPDPIDPSTLSPSGWWKAGTLSGAENSEIASWTDSSTNGRNLISSTTGMQPRYRRYWPTSLVEGDANGSPYVYFDGVNDLFTSSPTVLSSLLGADGEGTVFVVGRYIFDDAVTETIASHGLWSNASTFEANGLSFSMSTGRPYLLRSTNYYVGTANVATVKIPPDALPMVQDAASTGYAVNSYYGAQPFVAMWMLNRDIPRTYVGINNVDTLSLGSTGGWIEAGTSTAFWLGVARPNDVQAFWKGAIYEVIVFNFDLTEAQRQGIHLYLTQKYALPYGSGMVDDGAAAAALHVDMELPTTTLMLDPSLWLDAATITSSDGAVLSTWEDQSSNGYNVVQSDPDYQPVYESDVFGGGKPGVYFSTGTLRSSFLATSSGVTLAHILGGGGRGSVYAVCSAATSDTGQQGIWSSSTAVPIHVGQVVQVSTSGGGFLFANAVNTEGTLGTVSARSTDFQQLNINYVIWHHTGGWDASPDDIRGGVANFDTTDLASESSPETASTELSEKLRVGADLTGYIGELIAFPDAHTQEQRRHVLSYLHNKWGHGTYPHGSEYQSMWQDVTADVRIPEGIELEYGIQGTRVTDLMGSPGECDFALNNSIRNSGAAAGYYNPDSTARRTGFRVGTPVRISFTWKGTPYYKANGWIDDIEVGQGRERHIVKVHASDWLDYAARTTVATTGVVQNQSGDQLFFGIVAQLERPPERRLVTEFGTTSYPYAFDQSRDESLATLSEINRLCMSDRSYSYIKGDTLGGGTLVFESEGFQSTGIRWSMDETDLKELRVEHSLDNVVNRAIVEIHPRRLDATTTPILFSLGRWQKIVAGETLTFTAPYRDPDNGRYARVGGTDMQTPASTTDYIFSTTTSGASDLTALLTVGMTFGGNSANCALVNTSTQDGYLTLFQFHGRGVYAYESVMSEVTDSTSISRYGEIATRLDMPYQSDINRAAALAQTIVTANAVPRTVAKRVRFLANKSTTNMTHALAREVGDRVELTETVAGYQIPTGSYYIHRVKMKARHGTPLIDVEWELAPTT